MLRRGRGGGGSGYVLFLYYVHRQLAEIVNSLYFHARSLFQIYCILYTQIYNIYQTIIKGNVGLGILAQFLNMYIVSCMQDKIGKLTLSYYFNDRIIVK